MMIKLLNNYYKFVFRMRFYKIFKIVRYWFNVKIDII